MATVTLQPVAKAIYENTNGKIGDDFNLPMVFTNNNYRRYYFAYEIPSYLYLKRISIKLTESATCSSSSIHYWVPCSLKWYVIDNEIANIFTSSAFKHDDADSRFANSHSWFSKDYYHDVYDSPYGYGVFTSICYTGICKYLVVEVRGPVCTEGTATWTGYSMSITYDDTLTDNVENVYPISVNIKDSISNTFTWKYTNTVDLSELQDNAYGKPTEYVQPVLGRIIEYKKEGGDTVTVSDSSDNSQYTFVADTFDIGKYSYRIGLKLHKNYMIYSPWCEFGVIGQGSAPTITSVSNTSIPNISWTSTNQSAFELRLKNSAQETIFNSGMVLSTSKSFKLPMMLEDGNYIIEIRILNLFGYISEWGSSSFTLNPTKPSAPTNVSVQLDTSYGVVISASMSTTAYVVRRQINSNNIEIVSKYSGGNYIDYTLPANVYYEYTVRTYQNGYTDGEWVPVRLDLSGVMIIDGRNSQNYLILNMSESDIFDLKYDENVDSTLHRCLGRIYPIKEQGEWVSTQISFSAYVNETNYIKLKEINLKSEKVYFKSTGSYFACDMSISENGKYVDGGRFISFVLNRISEDESVML